jgi:hypothetical protein
MCHLFLSFDEALKKLGGCFEDLSYSLSEEVLGDSKLGDF